MEASKIPSELILQISAHLESESHLSLPIWSISPSSGYSSYQQSNYGFKKYPVTHSALLSLSSACHSLRCLLVPLIWSQIFITHPSKVGQLRKLVQYYKRMHFTDSEESREKEELRKVTPPNANEQKLPSPLPFVQHLFVQLDDRYPTFPQEILCELLRSGMNRRLRSLTWNAEALPNPAIWGALENYAFPDPKNRQADLTSDLESLEVDCKTFWGGHKKWSRLASLRHLRLTSYDAHLLPTFLPNLLSALKEPLLSLSLSTSKTSLLHELSPRFFDQQVQTISNSQRSDDGEFKGPFSQLRELDCYPVTPEQPLGESLAESGKALKHLRISLEVSGAFRNFDLLWTYLTDKMESLETLDVEPYPQQNTAPSFQAFVTSCPKLHLINGRRIDQLPPCLTPFDPDHLTSALAY